MTDETPETPFEDETEQKAWWVTHRWYIYSSAVAVVLAVLLGLVVFLRENLPLEWDVEWMDEIVDNRHPVLEFFSRVFDFIGGYWFGGALVPLAIVLALLFTRHRWGALYFAVASLVSFLVVQALKNIFDRPRPEEILIMIDTGSFPSGHVANAATVAVTLAIIFRRRWLWVLAVVYTVLMALSRTYLGAHWVSDTIGGVFVGVGIAVIVWAPLAYRLNHERTERLTADSARRR